MVARSVPDVSHQKSGAWSERLALQLTQEEGCLLRKIYFTVW